MKVNVIKIVGTALVCAVLGLASCYSPSPLYGTWSDNDGNKIQFVNDGTFSTTIKTVEGDVTPSGTYRVIENVISFTFEDGTVVSEWDLRGSILYLQWTITDSAGEKRTIQLSLYHTA